MFGRAGTSAQRLARMLCTSCKRRTIISAKTLQANGYKARVELEAYEPVGCRRCGGSGYRGRVGLYEVMSVDERVRTLVLEHGSVDEIAAAAEQAGMVRLREDGMQKVRAGSTSIAEIERMTSSLLS